MAWWREWKSKGGRGRKLWGQCRSQAAESHPPVCSPSNGCCFHYFSLKVSLKSHTYSTVAQVYNEDSTSVTELLKKLSKLVNSPAQYPAQGQRSTWALNKVFFLGLNWTFISMTTECLSPSKQDFLSPSKDDVLCQIIHNKHKVALFSDLMV